MYVDSRNDWPVPGPRKPQRPRNRLTKRQETVVVWIIGFNFLMLLLAPLAGVTLFDAIIAIMRG